MNAERLMTMCCACGLLEWKDGHYRNAEDVARFLVKGEPGYAAAWLAFVRWSAVKKAGKLPPPIRV